VKEAQTARSDGAQAPQSLWLRHHFASPLPVNPGMSGQFLLWNDEWVRMRPSHPKLKQR
jgi:hypothetical protein